MLKNINKQVAILYGVTVLALQWESFKHAAGKVDSVFSRWQLWQALSCGRRSVSRGQRCGVRAFARRRSVGR